MRYFLLLILIFISSLSVYSQEKPVQKSDSLYDATALRPVDLILNAPGWNFFSTDMYTYNFSNGLYGNYGPQPDILLDGIPVDVNFFGWQNLNMLPVYLPNILKVESNSDPGLYNEEFYPAGMFDFINRMPSNGLNLKGTIYLGNESGDPGPWIYDSSRVTPNVDRWGPDAGGFFSIRENNWYERIIFIQRKHQQTDPITHRRIHRTMRELGATQFYPVQTISKSGLFETGYISKTWLFKTRITLAEDQNYIFLQPFGREVPARAQYQQIALAAGYNTNKLEIGFRYILDQKKLKRRNSDHDYIFDWNQDNNLFKGSVALTLNSFKITSIINFDQLTTQAPGLPQINDRITGISFTTERVKNKYAKQQLSAKVDIHGDQAAKTIRASYFKKLNKYWSIKLDGYYNETLPIRQNSFGYWMSRGYNFYRELSIDLEHPLIINNNRLIHFRQENSFELNKMLTLIVTPELTHHYELNIPWQEIRYDTETGSAPGIFNISQESGTQFSFRARALHKPSDRIRQEVSLELRTSLQGSERFKDYYSQVPVAHIKYRIHIAPFRSLNLSLKGHYQSSTHWIEFDALDGQKYRDIDNLFPVFTGTYNSTAPSHLDIEIGAMKWFLDETFSIQFTVQNLLDDEVRLHPFGAERSLIFNIKASVNFK